MKTVDELRADFWNNDMNLNGGIIFKQYQDIKTVLSEDDSDLVFQRYQDIKKYAIKNVPFYKNQKIDEEFPVLNKRNILDYYESHKSVELFDKPLHVTSTSGSTGTPFSVLQDYHKRNRVIAELQVFGEMCDFPVRERMIFFRVLNDKIHRTCELEEKENIFYIDSSILDYAHLENMVQCVNEKNPRIIFSYSSTLIELAKHMLKNNSIFTASNLKTVLTGGEGIVENDRKMLEQVFKCKVYRRYSDMELGILGQDSSDGTAYTLNWGSYYFETLKTDCDEPAADGEVGRIVITDLFNKAFPMIRYDTGDLGIMTKTKGSSLPVLSEIYGRSRDCIYTTTGSLISPAKISVSMWGIAKVKQWQFIQEDKVKYRLIINAEDGFSPISIVDKLKGILGSDAQILVEYVNNIAVLSSNKRRAVICNYKPE